MTFLSLQESLRRELRERIEAGDLTGVELARRTGFTQAHISNFLNCKRGLKLAALDRTLKSVGLSLYDLLDPREIARFAALPADTDPEDARIPVVSAETAMSRPVILREDVRGLARYSRTLLARVRPDPAVGSRRTWTRFVVLEATATEAAAMSPRFSAGALLLVDRHYTTLQPYRRTDRNLYAVRRGSVCAIRYVETEDSFLILRPHSSESPVDVIPLPADRPLSDFVVGRVAHLAVEA